MTNADDTVRHTAEDGVSWVLKVRIHAPDLQTMRRRAKQVTEMRAVEPWVEMEQEEATGMLGRIVAALSTREGRFAVARRDVAAVYRLLQQVGISQRAIAALTGQQQSEVSEALGGRKVGRYDVLVRIFGGLGVPRGWAGLAYDEETAELLGDADESPVPDRFLTIR